MNERVWFIPFAEAAIHSSRRLPVLRRLAHEPPHRLPSHDGKDRRRAVRVRARRTLREVYGEDHFGWDGS